VPGCVHHQPRHDHLNIALPSLVRQLGASTRELQWVVDAYTLTFAALVLAAGSLSDRYGRKGAPLTGPAVFGTATAVGGLVDSPGALIAVRAVMGVGAAVIFLPPCRSSPTCTPSGASASLQVRAVRQSRL
jgi:MFS family permease